MSKFFKSTFKWCAAWVADTFLQKVLAYFYFFITPAVTAMWTRFDGFPWSIVFISTIGVFAMTVVSLYVFDMWIFAKSVKNKIFVEKASLSKWHTNKIYGKLQTMALGIIFKNLARFPIEFHVEKISSSIENSFNPKPTYNNKGIILQMGESITYWDDHIDVSALSDKKSNIEGKIEMTIKYGRPGKLKHTLYIKRSLEIYLIKENNMFIDVISYKDRPEQVSHDKET